MTFNFLGPGLTVNVEAKVKEQIILDSSDQKYYGSSPWKGFSKELVYKKDPNSIRRYALWHLKNKDFGRFTKLLLIYLSVLIERKKRKLSKKLAH